MLEANAGTNAVPKRRLNWRRERLLAGVAGSSLRYRSGTALRASDRLTPIVEPVAFRIEGSNALSPAAVPNQGVRVTSDQWRAATDSDDHYVFAIALR